MVITSMSLMKEDLIVPSSIKENPSPLILKPTSLERVSVNLPSSITPQELLVSRPRPTLSVSLSIVLVSIILSKKLLVRNVRDMRLSFKDFHSLIGLILIMLPRLLMVLTLLNANKETRSLSTVTKENSFSLLRKDASKSSYQTDLWDLLMVLVTISVKKPSWTKPTKRLHASQRFLFLWWINKLFLKVDCCLLTLTEYSFRLDLDMARKKIEKGVVRYSNGVG